MKSVGSRSISRIRTYNEDVLRARGVEVPKNPRIKKRKMTAQEIVDNTLKEGVLNASEFIGRKKEKVTDISSKEPIPLVKTSQTPDVIKPVTKKKPTVTKKKNKKEITSTLDEVVKKISTPKIKSVLTTEETIYDISNNDLTEGTLITNKKYRRVKFFPAIAGALQTWFKDATSKITKRKKPEHTINKAESRIATITAAARASKHAPQNDHGVVVKRLKKPKKRKREVEVSIKKKTVAPQPVWSSVTDISEENPEQKMPVPEVEILLTQDPTLTTFTEVEVSTPETPIIGKSFEKVEVMTPVEIPEIEKVIPVQVTEVQEPIPEEEEERVVKLPEPTPEKEEEKVEEDQEIFSVQQQVPQKKKKHTTTPKPVSGVPIYIYILIIIGASLLGIGVSVYWFMGSTSKDDTVVMRIPSLFISDTEVPVILEKNRRNILSTILDMSLASRDTTRIYPTITNAAGVEIPADAQTIFTALELRAPGSFTRSATAITFGGYNGTDPFILIQVTNFDTAFGGLLEWEPDMSEDLAPLFGTTVTQSYDPYARTDTQVRDAFFRDTIVANKSVRLLVDAQDNERILYAFVNPNLILITPNAATFTAILPLITQ